MVAEEKEKKEMMFWGIILVVLFIIFIVVRELWQHGTKPLGSLPLEWQAVLSITLLVITLIVVYYLHKLYTRGT